MRMTRKEFLQMAGAGWFSERALEALPLFRKREPFEPAPLSQNEDLTPIYRDLERNRDTHLENLREFILQPSVSATGEGIRECAAMVGEFMRRIGCEGIELVETDGHPMVFGFCDVGAPKDARQLRDV